MPPGGVAEEEAVNLPSRERRLKRLPVAVDRQARQLNDPVVDQRRDRDHRPAVTTGLPGLDRRPHRRLGDERDDEIELAAQRHVPVEHLAGTLE